MHLSNRIAFITGASSGIGRGTAKVFAAAGARVAVSARRRENLETLCEEIRAAGGVAQAFPADACNADELKAQIDLGRRNVRRDRYRRSLRWKDH